jgi:hypothetical protein
MSAMFLKASEIAERFRVSRDAVYLWIRQGKIPSECVIRIAGTIRVDEEEFEIRLRSGDLYRQVGMKSAAVSEPNTVAEDNVTVKRVRLGCEHRWSAEDASVPEEHPYSPQMRT